MNTSLSHERPVFGFWLYILSDCVLFAALFATYAVLRHSTVGGPGPGALLDLPILFIQTIALLVSNLAMALALVSGHGGSKKAALWWLFAALLLGFVFLGLEIREFSVLIAEGHGPARSAFLSGFFALVGTHGLHVALGSVWLLVVCAHLYLRPLQETMPKLRSLALFWHFLDIIWIIIFSLVYLLGSHL